MVVVIGGGDEVVWGGCIGWWWWEEKYFGSLIVDVANSHLRNLLIFFLERRLHSWYIGHKTSTSSKAFMVQLVEHLCRQDTGVCTLDASHNIFVQKIVK